MVMERIPAPSLPLWIQARALLHSGHTKALSFILNYDTVKPSPWCCGREHCTMTCICFYCGILTFTEGVNEDAAVALIERVTDA